MPIFGTRTMDAINEGMIIDEVDTIYFLSDGAPFFGRFENWQGIQQYITLLNRYRPIAFSTICFDPSAKNKKAMEALSDENYGHHESIDI